MRNDDVLITEHSTERFHLWRLILQPLSPLILTILLKILGSITLSFASSIKFMTYPFSNSVDSNGWQAEGAMKVFAISTACKYWMKRHFYIHEFQMWIFSLIGTPPKLSTKKKHHKMQQFTMLHCSNNPLYWRKCVSIL